jgi:polysaccharide export outer membrane protein
MLTSRIKFPRGLQSITLFLLFSFCFQACVSRKSSAYFQFDGDVTLPEQSVVFGPSDILSIHVTANDPELAAPFNPYASIMSPQATTYANGVASISGYLIDQNGDIEFPVVGKLHIGGLTRKDAINLLQDSLKNYLQNPAVNIRIQNFRVTVLGDVRSPGSFIIPNERITFIEALGLASDLNLTAKRENLLLIRSVNGVKKTYRIDLTKDNLFKSSECYYLQQNDVIYVEPNRAQRNSSAINSRLGVVVSMLTLLLTTLTLITQ